MSEICSICLKLGTGLEQIENSDESLIKWSEKLQRLIPELVWSPSYSICNNCKDLLNEAYNFKMICIELDQKRSFLEVTEQLYNCEHCQKTFESSLKYSNHTCEEFEDKPNLSEEEFICFHCNKNYDSKVSLISHIREQHQIKNEKRKKYECSKCKKRYTMETTMKQHEVNCDGIKRHSKPNHTEYQCPNCLEFYLTRKILNAHSKICSRLGNDPEKSNCQSCNIEFDSSELLKEHIKLLHASIDLPEKQKVKKESKSRKFLCDICNEEFGYVKVLVEHCKTEHGVTDVKPYACDKCENRFSSSANLIQHRKYHEGTRTHICSFCGKSFITNSDLTVHEYTHFNRRNYKCDQCDKAFNTNKNLRSHVKVVHTDSSLWKYCCSICERRFPIKSGYDQHMRRHAGDKRFSCHICSKSFVSRSEMQKHMSFHSNVRAFKCEHCEKEYKERKIFEIHMTKVHGIGNAKIPVRARKYVCHVCPSAFFDKQKLTRHLCTHSGLKPFSCDLCEKKFTDKSYLNQHLKNSHQINQAKEG